MLTSSSLSQWIKNLKHPFKKLSKWLFKSPLIRLKLKLLQQPKKKNKRLLPSSKSAKLKMKRQLKSSERLSMNLRMRPKLSKSKELQSQNKELRPRRTVFLQTQSLRLQQSKLKSARFRLTKRSPS